MCVIFTDINTVQYIYLQYIMFLLYRIIVFCTMATTEEEALAVSKDNDNDSNDNNDDGYTAVAAYWEDNEYRRHQSIKTTINHSSLRW